MLRVDHASAPFWGRRCVFWEKTQTTEINLGVARVATELLLEADRTCEVRGDIVDAALQSERLILRLAPRKGYSLLLLRRTIAYEHELRVPKSHDHPKSVQNRDSSTHL